MAERLVFTKYYLPSPIFIAFFSVRLDHVASFSQWTISRSGMYYFWVKEVKNQGGRSPFSLSLQKHLRSHVFTDEKLLYNSAEPLSAWTPE